MLGAKLLGPKQAFPKKSTELFLPKHENMGRKRSRPNRQARTAAAAAAAPGTEATGSPAASTPSCNDGNATCEPPFWNNPHAV